MPEVAQSGINKTLINVTVDNFKLQYSEIPLNDYFEAMQNILMAFEKCFGRARDRYA